MTPTVPLGEIATVVPGGRKKLTGADLVTDGYPAFGAGGINGLLPDYEFEVPAVVLSSIGARCGKCFFAEGRWSSLANTQLIFPDVRRVDARYLWYQLDDEASWHRSGTAQPFIKTSDIRSRHVAVPPLPEQRRIAAILDAAGELRATRRASMALFDSLVESALLDLIGRAEQWPRRTVASLAADRPHAIRTGPFGSQLLHSEFVSEGEVAVLGIDNAVQDHFEWAKPRFITAEKFESVRRYQVHPGDLLVTIMATCGRVAIVPDDVPLAINTKHLCCISLDEQRCLPQYLWAAFRFEPRLRHQLGATTRGAVMPGLNMGLIKAATVPLPPIELQREFVDRLFAIEAAAAEAAAHAEHLDELFGSLRQRALRGEV